MPTDSIAPDEAPAPAPDADATAGCCAGPRAAATPNRGPGPDTPGGSASDALRAAVTSGLVALRGSFFDMGARKSRYPDDHDSPRRKVHLGPFRIGRHAVTNRLFAQFVVESGYRTTAETEGWSAVFHLFLPDPAAFPNHPPRAPWWRMVPGATWYAPEGPGSDVLARQDHPVVHLSWFDAAAFCAFTGTRLPTEAEWEYAARGGLVHKRFPWGNELEPQGTHRHNVWQGEFPHRDTGLDGHSGTAPVDAYAPNGFGLWNMTGNVWEWCADWFGRVPITPRPPHDPKGPPGGPGRVIRGGSHLCHASYCERYQVHSRTHNTPDSSTGHMGFRLAADGPADA